MRKFTPTEIDLCKRIAEKEWKEIEVGDWFWDEELKHPGLRAYYTTTHQEVEKKYKIPLWQEHDCLEWLGERCKYHVLLIHEEDEAEWWVWFDEYQKTQQYDKGKTPLEALLRVVLAVLKA